MVHIEENDNKNYNNIEFYSQNTRISFETRYKNLNKNQKNIVVQELLNMIDDIENIKLWLKFIMLILIVIFIWNFAFMLEDVFSAVIIGLGIFIVENMFISFIFRAIKLKYIVKAENIILLENIKNSKIT